ncbi:TIGR01841 family phasin [Cupriavidus sp. CP313]
MSASMAEQFAALQKSRFESLFALSKPVVEGFPTLTELNLQAATSALEYSQGQWKIALDNKDFKERFIAKNLATPGGIENGIDYARQLFEFANTAQLEASHIAEAKYEAQIQSMQILVDSYVKNAPASAEVLGNLLQSSVALTASTFELMQRAANEVLATTRAYFFPGSPDGKGSNKSASARVSKS